MSYKHSWCCDQHDLHDIYSPTAAAALQQGRKKELGRNESSVSGDQDGSRYVQLFYFWNTGAERRSRAHTDVDVIAWVQRDSKRWQQLCWREGSTCLPSAPVPLRRLDSLKNDGSMGLTRSRGGSWPASTFVWQLRRRCWSLIVDRLLRTPWAITQAAQSDTLQLFGWN